VIDAVKTGALKRFVLIGGCDGSEMDRSYYTRLATHLPDESVILTLGCAKFRVIGKKEYGVVPGTGIPRVLDMGQCNDAYSAVVVASELAKAFGTDVNSLPLSIVLSWLEQKVRRVGRSGMRWLAVCPTSPIPRHLPQAAIVLLALLHLGVKNIRIGPELPAFITPKTLGFLVANFNISQIKADAADGDVDAVMGRVKA
jgi:hydroxylamine reductase